MTNASHPRDYERSDVDPGLVGAIAMGLVVFLGLTPFVLRAIYPHANQQIATGRDLPRPPPTRLEVKPLAQLQRLRSWEDGQLNSSGWIDREHQVARIPIDRAMALLAARGLAGWPQPSSTPSSP